MRRRAIRSRSEAGLTLMEVLIAISLLSLLSVGILMAMRVGLDALGKADRRLMDNRRVAGAARILEQQIGGFIPAFALCTPAPEMPVARLPFFQGEPQSMRFVSAYSLNGAWRGTPQILEYLVIPGQDGHGVRLVVNEIPYVGAQSTGALCLGRLPDPMTGAALPRFRPIEAGPRSFVVADNLAACRFLYLETLPPPIPDRWTAAWVLPRWPAAIRIEMTPLEPETARLAPVTLTVPVQVVRSPEIEYADY